MPIREYLCQKCGYRFENLELKQVEQPPSCPTCASTDLQRLFSAFAVGQAGSSGQPACGDGGACSSCDMGGCPYGDGFEE